MNKLFKQFGAWLKTFAKSESPSGIAGQHFAGSFLHNYKLTIGQIVFRPSRMDAGLVWSKRFGSDLRVGDFVACDVPVTVKVNDCILPMPDGEHLIDGVSLSVVEGVAKLSGRVDHRLVEIDGDITTISYVIFLT